MLTRFDDMLDMGRRVNLNSLRLLSLALLFLSLTPLASLFVVFSSSWGFQDDSDIRDINNNNNEASFSSATDTDSTMMMGTTNLLSVLRNPNATLQEILEVVLLERAHTTVGGVPSMAYHWAAVIPWVLSMVFGFVIPIILYIMSLIRSRRLSQMRATDYNAYRIRRRRDRLQSYLSKFTKTLTNEDRDTAFFCSIPGDPNSVPSWIIPKPGAVGSKGGERSTMRLFYRWQAASSSSSNNACNACQDSRSVTGLCAICLNNYEKGQNVVWSSNPGCCHAFHLDCLLDWFSARRRKHHLCPCCRQVFFSKHK